MNPPSPFALAKTIRDFGSYMPVAFGGLPYDPEEHRQACARWRELGRTPLSPLVENPEFFGNQMWDAFLLELQISNESVRLALCVGDARSFAIALSELLGIPRRIGPYPIELVMHDPTYVRAVTYDHSGTLRNVDLQNRATMDGESIGGINNEWFYPHEEGLGWVVEVYYDGSRVLPGASVHLLVQCARASAVDRRLPALIAAFGPTVELLWNETLARFQRPGEPRLWIENDIWDFLEGRLAAHALTRSDFA